jgi:hypothetical protein
VIEVDVVDLHCTKSVRQDKVLKGLPIKGAVLYTADSRITMSKDGF